MMRAVTSSATLAVVHKEQDDWRELGLTSGETQHFSLDTTGTFGYVHSSPDTTVEVAKGTQEAVQGYGKLNLLVTRPLEEW